MFQDRVRHHLHRAGWTVTDAPDLGGFRPDLLVERKGRKKAVLVRDDAPGPLALARFGAEARKRGLGAIVVAPDDPVVLELCENAQLEFLPAGSIGEIPVVGVAPEPAPLAPPVVVGERVRPAAPVAAVVHRAPVIPLWRWAIVAVIWAAALAVVAYDVIQILGGATL